MKMFITILISVALGAILSCLMMRQHMKREHTKCGCKKKPIIVPPTGTKPETKPVPSTSPIEEIKQTVGDVLEGIGVKV